MDGATQRTRSDRRLSAVWSEKVDSLVEASFTKLQGQYLAFIAAYAKVNGRPPAEADIQRHFKVTPPTVHQMILTLEKRGLIARTPRQSRSIEVLVPREQLPLLD